MVYVEVDQAPALVTRLRGLGLLCNDTGPRRIRLVTHLDLLPEMVPEAVARFARALGA